MKGRSTLIELLQSHEKLRRLSLKPELRINCQNLQWVMLVTMLTKRDRLPWCEIMAHDSTRSESEQSSSGTQLLLAEVLIKLDRRPEALRIVQGLVSQRPYLGSLPSVRQVLEDLQANKGADHEPQRIRPLAQRSSFIGVTAPLFLVFPFSAFDHLTPSPKYLLIPTDERG